MTMIRPQRIGGSATHNTLELSIEEKGICFSYNLFLHGGMHMRWLELQQPFWSTVLRANAMSDGNKFKRDSTAVTDKPVTGS